MLITMQNTHPAWPVKTKLRMTLDWSGIAKETAMMGGVEFLSRAGGRHCFILARNKNKIRKIFKENWSIIAQNRAITSTNHTNLERQEQTQWIEMHQSQVNMCFLRGPIG